MTHTFKWLALAVALAAPFAAQAHKSWLQPSQTVLPANKPWVTVDAAVSNDLFYFNHVPLRLDNLAVIAPDGSSVAPQNKAMGKYRSVFDVELVQPGTYRMAVVNRGLSAQWQENGQPKRWRGNATAFATEVPKDAAGLQVSEMFNRVETFVTAGEPTELKASGEGLELAPVTHPNDLFAGEAARFKLQLDGKPAANTEIEIVRGNTRYRNAQDEITVITDADGSFSVTWPEPGMYWMEVVVTDAKTSVPQAKQRRLGYVATLEVLPQ